MDTVLPQSRVEKNKDKHLHDMIQKYSSCQISREQYLGLNTKQERNYDTKKIVPCLHVYICFKYFK